MSFSLEPVWQLGAGGIAAMLLGIAMLEAAALTQPAQGRQPGPGRLATSTRPDSAGQLSFPNDEGILNKASDSHTIKPS